MHMSGITFEVEKMFRLPQAGHLKAFADVSINKAVIIRGVRVMEGKKGFFVSLPREQGKDSKWYDQVSCCSTEIYDDLAARVLAHYQDQDKK